eukprot:3240799-Rhodomonas_salina.1
MREQEGGRRIRGDSEEAGEGHGGTLEGVFELRSRRPQLEIRTGVPVELSPIPDPVPCNFLYTCRSTGIPCTTIVPRTQVPAFVLSWKLGRDAGEAAGRFAR